jgi:hypothetical protein
MLRQTKVGLQSCSRTEQKIVVTDAGTNRCPKKNAGAHQGGVELREKHKHSFWLEPESIKVKGFRVTYRRQPEELPGQGGVSDRLSGNSMIRPLSEDDVPLER